MSGLEHDMKKSWSTLKSAGEDARTTADLEIGATVSLRVELKKKRNIVISSGVLFGDGGGLFHVDPVLMAVVAEGHVVGLIFYQQVGLQRRMRLMARKATERRLDLGLIGGVHHVGHGVILDGMAEAEAQGQDGDLVLCEVVFRELHGSVKNSEEMVRVVALGCGIRTVALKA